LVAQKIQEDTQRNQETKAQNEFLRRQLGTVLKQKQKMNEETLQSEPRRQEQVFSHEVDSSSEDEPIRMARAEPRMQANANNFKVEIPKFEGKLDPYKFLDWLRAIESLSIKMSRG